MKIIFSNESESLYVTWRTPDKDSWTPIGKLTYYNTPGIYEFEYTNGAKQMKRPLLNFPDFTETYQSENIFPIFQNRLMNPKRKDYEEYLKSFGLPLDSTPMKILYYSTGKRMTDNIQLIPYLNFTEKQTRKSSNFVEIEFFIEIKDHFKNGINIGDNGRFYISKEDSLMDINHWLFNFPEYLKLELCQTNTKFKIPFVFRCYVKNMFKNYLGGYNVLIDIILMYHSGTRPMADSRYEKFKIGDE